MNTSGFNKCERCANNLCARKVPMFSGLLDLELREIIELTGNKDYKKGEPLFLEGDLSETLYILNAGKVKLSKITRDGKEQILHILSPGDFFGELNLFGNKHISNFSAFAISDTNICTLAKKQLDGILSKKPDIALKILSTVSDRLAQTENLAQNLSTKDIGTRIAFILQELAEKYGIDKEGSIYISLPISREEMANYAGVTRETMSRKLKDLEDRGILSLEKSRVIIIKDNTALLDMLG